MYLRVRIEAEPWNLAIAQRRILNEVSRKKQLVEVIGKDRRKYPFSDGLADTMRILGAEFKITVAAYQHIAETVDCARRHDHETARYCFICWGGTGVLDDESIPGPGLAFDPTDMGLGESPNFYLIEGNKVAIGLDRR